MTKNQKVSNGARFEFLNWDLILVFVSDFDIRISDLFRWRPFAVAQDMLGAKSWI
jgi:hypothetical protein